MKSLNTTISAVLVAGGSGQRFGLSGQSKLMLPLGDHPLLAWSAAALLACSAIDQLVIVAHSTYLSEYQQALAPWVEASSIPVNWVLGGATRRASVFESLKTLAATYPPDDAGVLIHDAARPFLAQSALTQLIQAFRSSESSPVWGVSLGSPMPHSLKRVQKVPSPDEPIVVQSSVDRTDLWQVHTPQLCRWGPLWQAHHQVPEDPTLTDDLALLERWLLRHPQAIGPEPILQMVEDGPSQFKWTTPADKPMAQALAALFNEAPRPPAPLPRR